MQLNSLFFTQLSYNPAYIQAFGLQYHILITDGE